MKKIIIYLLIFLNILNLNFISNNLKNFLYNDFTILNSFYPILQSSIIKKNNLLQ